MPFLTHKTTQNWIENVMAILRAYAQKLENCFRGWREHFSEQAANKMRQGQVWLQAHLVPLSNYIFSEKKTLWQSYPLFKIGPNSIVVEGSLLVWRFWKNIDQLSFISRHKTSKWSSVPTWSMVINSNENWQFAQFT